MAWKKELYTALILIGVRNEQLDILPTYLPTYLSIYGSMVFFVGPLPLFQFLDPIVTRTWWAWIRGARSRGNARHTVTLGFD
jgi:hypothetical protein